MERQAVKEIAPWVSGIYIINKNHHGRKKRERADKESLVYAAPPGAAGPHTERQDSCSDR